MVMAIGARSYLEGLASPKAIGTLYFNSTLVNLEMKGKGGLNKMGSCVLTPYCK